MIKIASSTLTEQYNPNLFNNFYETYPKGFVVAEINHKIIGFIIGIKNDREVARILMLSVLPQYRRQKIGSILLNYFLKHMITQNIKQVELEVRTDNKIAINFYKNHGFFIKEIISNFYLNEDDAYTMILYL